jgi:predicted acyltransferase
VAARDAAARDARPRSDAAGGRLRFLDVARALAVVTMLVGNLINVFVPEHPRWLAHNLGDELLPFDLPAPIFQFLIGVSLALFLARRSAARDGGEARLLAVRRFAILVVLGAVLDGIAAGRLEFRWGVLQTLGVGGLVATALATSSDVVVLAVAAAILVTHYGPGNNEVHRSALDCLPFVPLTLLGYVVGRPLARRDHESFKRRASVTAALCVGLAIVLRLAGIPYNKVTGTSSFVLLTSSVSAVLLLGVEYLEESGWVFPPALSILGANALTAWVLQYVVVFYPVYFLLGSPVALPELAGLAVVGMTVLVLSLLTLALAGRGFRIPL